MHVDEADRLAKAAADGDAAAWAALVTGFSGLVWAITRAYRLNSANAADVFQTVWLRLAENLGRIDDPRRLGAWLATTARRESLRAARSASRVILAPDMAVLDTVSASAYSPEQAVLDSEQAALDEERAARLWRAFRELPERCQRLLRLLIAAPPPSYAEVAAALDMRVGSIGPTRARCLRQLRLRLTGDVFNVG